MKITRILAALAFALLAGPALAQSSFVTPGGSRVNGVVFMCLDGSGNAIPAVNSGNCIGAGGGGGGGAITAASGSYSSGALASGSIASGAMVDLGAQADAAAIADTSTASLIALIKRNNQNLTTIATNTSSVVAGVSVATTSAAASSLVAKASAGSVVSISGSAVSGSYIMLFNATTAPVDGAVTPLKCYGPMAAAGPFVVSWGVGPVLTASTGITVVSSSTGCFTKTATNANFLSVEYQ